MIRRLWWKWLTRGYRLETSDFGSVTFNKPPKRDWPIVIVTDSNGLTRVYIGAAKVGQFRV